jgi:hypothetical protein
MVFQLTSNSVPKTPSLNALSTLYGEETARRMSAATTMQRIKATVALSRNPILDLSVSLARDVSSAIDPLCIGETRRVFLDVPLDAIIALGHKNFAPAARTWRSLLEGLHGVGWEQSAIDWMESEIGISWLPAPSAKEGLRLYATGGALRCHNGNHRLVAAVCWLAASSENSLRKETCVLRKVDVEMRQVDPQTARLLMEAIDAGYRVEPA